MSRTHQVKRKSDAQVESAFRALQSKRRKLLMPALPDRPITKNPIAQQTIRVGGWASPSLGGELKFKDTNLSYVFPSGSTVFSAATLLNGIAPGSDATSRIGRKVTIKSLLLRWTTGFTAAANAPDADGGFNTRILVVYDKQPNANTAAITDVLKEDFFSSVTNLDNRDRFVILMDKITPPASMGGDLQTSGKKFIRLNNEEVFNAGTAGTIGDITTGSILLFVAQSGGGTYSTGNAMGFNGRARIRYQDN